MKPIYRKHASPIRKLLLMKAAAGGKPLVEYTATGNPVTFETNVAKPLKSLLIPWTPSQSGSGDPSPSNVRPISGVSAVNVWRTGKNLFDKSEVSLNKWINGNGQIGNSSYSQAVTGFIPVKPGQRITISAYKNDNYLSCFYADKTTNNPIHYEGATTALTNTKFPVTVPDGANYIRITLANSGVNSFQVENGSTSTEYEPYSGESYSVVFPALGKNLLKLSADTLAFCSVPTAMTITYSSNNSAVVTSTYNFANYVVWDIMEITQSMVGKKYCATVTAPSSLVISETAEWNTRGKGVTNSYTITSEDVGKRLGYRCYCYGQVTWTFENIIVNEGDSLAPFEPYTNTVYGGSLDLTTGVMTVECALVTLTANNATIREGQGYYGRVLALNRSDIANNNGSYVLCNQAINTAVGTEGAHFRVPSVGEIWVSLPSCATQEGAQAALDAGDIQVTYKLKTAQTVQLTPQQITALIGDNNIWSDTNGTNTVVYLKRG